MAGENGMAILMRTLGVDPKAIMEGVTGFGEIAKQVQLTVATIDSRLTNIENGQAEILRLQTLIAETFASIDARLTEVESAQALVVAPQTYNGVS